MSFIAITIGIIGREFITYRFQINERKKGYFFKPEQEGIRVLGIIPGTLADKLEIKPGELLTKVNGRSIHKPEDLEDEIREASDHIQLEIYGDEGTLRHIQNDLDKDANRRHGFLFIESPHRLKNNLNAGGEQMAAKEKNEWLEWTKAILFAVGLVLIVRMFLFAPIIVDGPSMQPTLYDRDQMIVNKFSYYFKEPERFDIVVFHASSQKDFIKRVIGLPGEHVAVIDNVLHINGEPMEEPFLPEEDETSLQSRQNDFTLEELPGNYDVIPEGYVLVLGDNRSNSTDSRMIGLIPIDQIVGKASLIYWPLDRIQFVGN
mgnify:FL=1